MTLLFIIKVITVIVAAISISKSYIDFRKKREPLGMFLFWSAVWLAASIIIAYPSLINQANSYFKGNALSISTLTALALIFMLYLVYRMYLKLNRLEYNLTELVRKIGLDGSNSKNDKA